MKRRSFPLFFLLVILVLGTSSFLGAKSFGYWQKQSTLTFEKNITIKVSKKGREVKIQGPLIPNQTGGNMYLAASIKGNHLTTYVYTATPVGRSASPALTSLISTRETLHPYKLNSYIKRTPNDIKNDRYGTVYKFAYFSLYRKQLKLYSQALGNVFLMHLSDFDTVRDRYMIIIPNYAKAMLNAIEKANEAKTAIAKQSAEKAAAKASKENKTGSSSAQDLKQLQAQETAQANKAKS